MQNTTNVFVTIALVMSMLMFTTPVHAQSDFQIKKVIIAKAVANRNPRGVFTPPAYCEKDKSGQAAIPIVKASETSRVFFWTKVSAARKGTLRHSWHHQIGGTWTKVSEVTLSIRPATGYRTWSLKSLKPEIHKGEWMVVVAPSNRPEEIICISRFTVQ